MLRLDKLTVRLLIMRCKGTGRDGWSWCRLAEGEEGADGEKKKARTGPGKNNMTTRQQQSRQVKRRLRAWLLLLLLLGLVVVAVSLLVTAICVFYFWLADCCRCGGKRRTEAKKKRGGIGLLVCALCGGGGWEDVNALRGIIRAWQRKRVQYWGRVVALVCVQAKVRGKQGGKAATSAAG